MHLYSVRSVLAGLVSGRWFWSGHVDGAATLGGYLYSEQREHLRREVHATGGVEAGFLILKATFLLVLMHLAQRSNGRIFETDIESV